MSRLSASLGLLIVTLLSGCVVESGSLDRARRNFDMGTPRPHAFQVCGDHGCEKHIPVSLNAAEWRHVQAPFRRRARSAGDERRAIAEYLRRMEVLVGAKTGYDTDEAFSNLQLSGNSQDCVDEMVNVSVYLEMLENAGHLRLHRQGQRVTLGMMTRRFWTHTVATIVQKNTGQEFIIDTWAVKIGQTPYVMDRAAWAGNAPFRHDF